MHGITSIAVLLPVVEIILKTNETCQLISHRHLHCTCTLYMYNENLNKFRHLPLGMNISPSTHVHLSTGMFFPDVQTDELPGLFFRYIVKISCSCWLQMTGRLKRLLSHSLHASSQVTPSLSTVE